MRTLVVNGQLSIFVQRRESGQFRWSGYVALLRRLFLPHTDTHAATIARVKCRGTLDRLKASAVSVYVRAMRRHPYCGESSDRLTRINL
jgi:hypothetical protein